MRDTLYELINPVPQLLRDFDFWLEHGTQVEDYTTSRQHVTHGLTLLYRSLNVCHALQAWEAQILMLCHTRQSSFNTTNTDYTNSSPESAQE
jgi:hypothetical protein